VSVQLIPSAVQGAPAIAEELRALAARIESGEIPSDTVTVLLEQDSDIIGFSLLGRPRNSLELAGLFFTCAGLVRDEYFS
jgi:hypothetical protein